jgi:hypothetical protein
MDCQSFTAPDASKTSVTQIVKVDTVNYRVGLSESGVPGYTPSVHVKMHIKWRSTKIHYVMSEWRDQDIYRSVSMIGICEIHNIADVQRLEDLELRQLHLIQGCQPQ